MTENYAYRSLSRVSGTHRSSHLDRKQSTFASSISDFTLTVVLRHGAEQGSEDVKQPVKGQTINRLVVYIWYQPQGLLEGLELSFNSEVKTLQDSTTVVL